MQFQKGHSGNPTGRPLGARNRRTILAEQLLDGRAESILERVFELVDSGDPAALRLCMDRISPRLKERPVVFTLPELVKAGDAAAALAAIARGLADGDLAPAEAADLGRFVQSFAQAVAATDLEERITRIEGILSRTAL
jgi:hypothetical protein